MITTTLELRYGFHPVREPVAWCIASYDPAVWLREITAWNVPHRSLRLLALPRSPSDRRPLGVLVTSSPQTVSKVSQHCVPFGRVADRLYVPIEARFDPDVSDAELRALLSDPYTYVWRPACGMVAFEAGDMLSVADLLAIGPAGAGRWDRAESGVAFSRRLTALLPEQQLTIEATLEEGRGDIGSESGSMGELPPSPLEPKKDALSATSRGGRRILARIVRWLAQRVPATASEPTWINRLEQWAERQLSSLRAGLSAARNKEIARLMHMLQTDPDRGLRFAIPIGGAAHRGRAAPGGRLVEQDVDFNLRRLGGGKPADFWEVEAEYQHQLMARYRELANRETRLGRRRRAAYIFGELLGDLDAAANTLVSGHHWREAAVLYRKRLNRPLDAARCLEQGGLWNEAIELYVELGRHEKAGDLYQQLDQQAQARDEYRKAVDKHRDEGDPMSAARLLDEKLLVPDEAVDVLARAWPDSPQAGRCLRQIFQIWGRLGRHDASMAWVNQLCSQPSPAGRGLLVVDILADTATGYPDGEVKHQAADSARAVVSRQLKGAARSDRRQLLGAVARLVPEDRLLGRDCQRYLQQTPAAPTPAPPRKPTRKKTPTLVRSIQLPSGVDWKAATASGKSIYAAGFSSDTVLLVRSSWHDLDLPGKVWKVESRLTTLPILLCAEPQNENHVLVHVMGGPPLGRLRTFPPSDRCPEQVHVGPVAGVTSGIRAAERTYHGITWLVEFRGGEWTLVAMGPEGEQISTEIIAMREPSEPVDDCYYVFPVPLHARGEQVYVGIRNRMMIFDRDKPTEIVEFGQPVTSLAGSAPNTRTRVAVTFATGGEIYWDDFEGRHSEAFASDMPDPVVSFNRGGYLIAASKGACEVYATHGRRAQLVAITDLPGPHPVAVLGGPQTDQFGIVFPDGVIRVYELP